MNGNHMRILIVGCGSVGKRHAENLIQLGCRIACCDPREDRRKELLSLLENKAVAYPDIEEALKSEHFDGAVIGSPTSFHVEQSKILLRAGISVLLEKPVSITLEDALDLQRVEQAVPAKLLLGYTWRWWEPLSRVKELLEQGRIGAIRHVQMYMSAHLADWHPWEKYQDFFMAKKSLGGGALLDESHWIDLMIWFFGLPQNITGTVEKISDLEIDTDDNVDILAHFADGKKVYVHLDLFGRPHERFIRFVGEKGTLFWSSDPNEIRMTLGESFDVDVETFGFARNDMFLGVAEEFMDLIDGRKELTCSLDDGIRAMKIIEAVRESSESGKKIDIF